MKLKPGLHHITISDLDSVAEAAKLGEWRVFELDGREIIDRNSFFDCARANLPMDPPLSSNRSWDALSDSLWGGLDALSDSRILIVWRNASTMASAVGSDYEIAEEILGDLASSLGRLDETDGDAKEVCVVIA